jgi:hypothetical protein
MSTGPGTPSANPAFSHALEAADIGPWHWDTATDTVSLSRQAAGLLH